jgi:predicted nucleic acid-binding protein
LALSARFPHNDSVAQLCATLEREKVMSDYSILAVLMRRDGMSRSEAQELIDEARELVADGENPEEILRVDFGLEPDYIFDLL